MIAKKTRELIRKRIMTLMRPKLEYEYIVFLLWWGYTFHLSFVWDVSQLSLERDRGPRIQMTRPYPFWYWMRLRTHFIPCEDFLIFNRFYFSSWNLCRSNHPFKLNEISNWYQLDQCIPILNVLGGTFHFYSNFHRTFCKQTVETLIRRHVMWRLVWVCTVCQCLTNRILGLYWLTNWR